MKKSLADLEQALSRSEQKLIRSLTTPFKIQQFLDSLPYSTDDWNRCPLTLLKDRVANCYDGGLFAAAALSRLGYPPLVTYLIAVRDDEHLLALYKKGGFWGAVAKSNVVGLRFREPIHRTLRELILSYFDAYFNVLGRKTLRAYTAAINLSRFDRLSWMTKKETLEPISDAIDALHTYPLLNRKMIAGLSPVDPLTYRAQFLDSNPAGLYRPDK